MSFLRNIARYPARIFPQWDDWRIKSSVILAVSGMVWSMVSANRSYPKRWTTAGLVLGGTGLYVYVIASIRLWYDEGSDVSSRRSSNVQSIGTSGISGSGTISTPLNTNSTGPSQSSSCHSIATTDDLPPDVEEALKDEGGARGDLPRIIADAMRDYNESAENSEDYDLMSQIEVVKRIALLLKKCERHIGVNECAQSRALYRDIAQVLKNFEHSLKPKSQTNVNDQDIINNGSVSDDTPEDAIEIGVEDFLPIRIKLPPALEGELAEGNDMKHQQCKNFIEDPLNAPSGVEDRLPALEDELAEDYDMKHQQCKNFIEDPLNAPSGVDNRLPALEDELSEGYNMKNQQCKNFIDDPLNAPCVVENILHGISDLNDELIPLLNNDKIDPVPNNGSVENRKESLSQENPEHTLYLLPTNGKKLSSPNGSITNISKIDVLNSSGVDEFNSKPSAPLKSPKSEIPEDPIVSDLNKNDHEFTSFSECDSNNHERFGSDSFFQDDLSVSVSVTKSTSDSCRMDLSLMDVSMDVSQIHETSDVVPKLALNDAFIDEENVDQLKASHSKEESNEF